MKGGLTLGSALIYLPVNYVIDTTVAVQWVATNLYEQVL
jgi:hypothetical protein